MSTPRTDCRRPETTQGATPPARTARSGRTPRETRRRPAAERVRLAEHEDAERGGDEPPSRCRWRWRRSSTPPREALASRARRCSAPVPRARCAAAAAPVAGVGELLGSRRDGARRARRVDDVVECGNNPRLCTVVGEPSRVAQAALAATHEEDLFAAPRRAPARRCRFEAADGDPPPPTPRPRSAWHREVLGRAIYAWPFLSSRRARAATGRDRRVPRPARDGALVGDASAPLASSSRTDRGRGFDGSLGSRFILSSTTARRPSGSRATRTGARRPRLSRPWCSWSCPSRAAAGSRRRCLRSSASPPSAAGANAALGERRAATPPDRLLRAADFALRLDACDCRARASRSRGPMLERPRVDATIAAATRLTSLPPAGASAGAFLDLDVGSRAFPSQCVRCLAVGPIRRIERRRGLQIARRIALRARRLPAPTPTDADVAPRRAAIERVAVGQASRTGWPGAARGRSRFSGTIDEKATTRPTTTRRGRRPRRRSSIKNRRLGPPRSSCRPRSYAAVGRDARRRHGRDSSTSRHLRRRAARLHRRRQSLQRRRGRRLRRRALDLDGAPSATLMATALEPSRRERERERERLHRRRRRVPALLGGDRRLEAAVGEQDRTSTTSTASASSGDESTGRDADAEGAVRAASASSLPTRHRLSRGVGLRQGGRRCRRRRTGARARPSRAT